MAASRQHAPVVYYYTFHNPDVSQVRFLLPGLSYFHVKRITNNFLLQLCDDVRWGPMSMIVYLFNLQLEEVTSLLLQRRSTVGQLMELVMAFCKDRAALTKKSSKIVRRQEIQ